MSGFKGLRSAAECLGEHGELFGRPSRIFAVDGLVDAGNDDSGIAGVFAGGVDRVPVPGPVGQAGGR